MSAGQEVELRTCESLSLSLVMTWRARANVKLKVQLDVLEHDFPLELHDRTRRVQLEQLVRAQAVPRKRVVVFEQLARQEGEQQVMMRG